MKLKRKEKKKPVITETEQKEEKVSVIKTDSVMKIGRILLWAVILFLLLKGIAGILAPNSEEVLEKKIIDYRAEAELRENIQVKATAFAENFAYEYYTFSGKYNSDYEQRLKRYLAKNLEIRSPSSGPYSTSVSFATAENIHYKTEKDFDVDVHLQVEYTPLEEGLVKQQKDIYIRVPLQADKKEEYAVTSLPVYIPKTEAAKLTAVDTYKGLQVETSEVNKIKETLNSFLTVYYSGTTNEITYYLTADSDITAAASGMVEYQRLDYATVCQEEGTREYLVDAKYTVTDNGQVMQQRVFIRLQYAKKHYYIKSINTRPV